MAPEAVEASHSSRRRSALETVNGILSDIGYYRHFTHHETPPEPVRRPRAQSLPPCGQDGWYREKLAQGWSYERYKATLNQSEEILSGRPPSRNSMELFKKRKKDDEAAVGIVSKCLKSPSLYANVRRILTSWQMKSEMDALHEWMDNKRTFELNLLKGRRFWNRMKQFMGSFCAIEAWRDNKRRLSIIEPEPDEEAEDVKLAAKEATDFARRFLAAVDDDDDGGLSWCELKAAVRIMMKKGYIKETEEFEWYVKASIWLMNDRNFQKYDINSVGVIEEKELAEAMLVFLKDHWKYEGTLW